MARHIPLFPDTKVRYVLLWLIAGGVVFGLAFYGLREYTELYESILFLATFFIFMLWAVWQMRRHEVRVFDLVRPSVRSVRLRRIAIAFICSIATSLFAGLLLDMIPFLDLTDRAFYAEGDIPAALWVNGITIFLFLVAAPLVEEYVFRGVMIGAWISRWGVRKALYVSSFIFALLHAEPVGSFLFAVIVGSLYLRTRSLRIPILFHVVNNVVAITPALVLETRSGYEPPDVEMQDMIYAVSFFFILALVTLPPTISLIRENIRLYERESIARSDAGG